MLLDLRDDRVLGDRAADDDGADQERDDDDDEHEWAGGGACARRWAGGPCRHQRARCARKSSSRIVAAPASTSRAPRSSASLEV